MPKLTRRVLETVLVFIRDARGRYLFFHRGKKPGDVHAGKYNAPGGKVDAGESPIETLRREVLEETGLTVTAFKRIGFLSFPAFHTDDEGSIDESMHLFLVTDFTGELLAESDEGVPEWIEPHEIERLPLWEGDRLFIPHVLNEQRIEGKLIYKSGKLVDWQLTVEGPGADLP